MVLAKYGQAGKKGGWRKDAHTSPSKLARSDPFTAVATIMAFRNVLETLSPLLFLLCLNLLTDKKTAAVSIREKCMCFRETHAVLWRHMTDFNVIDSGPHCNKVQILISTGEKTVCLAPNSKQGKVLQKCWKRINFNERKKKKCRQPRKVKQRPKKPKTP